ncbi:alpha carbonic anhydrase 7 [Punica granatum]|uniref:Carbonic anhydrase n=1 Tax=Punica granatum TaxID=22663 RepID=A0A218WMB7_PUNGR|nr:alpha carbonic anhydrase 7 [Punica granatum]OWM73786.1 hypothetical protein CDL15_Pgr026890 [Punica granatum]
MGRMIGSSRLLFCIFLFTLPLFSLRTASEEVEDESEFNYVEGSKIGPSRWGEIRPEWRTCKNGSMQSPIDLMSKSVEIISHLGDLRMSYRPSNATLKNRGHDIMLRWEGGAGSMHINGTEYVLQQCHWHSPSEHSIDGKRFDVELHLVHETPNGEAAVVGIMYKYGPRDTFLSSIMDHLGAIAETGEAEKAIGVVHPKGIKILGRKYYRYIGSLTTPPCTENVKWIIFQKVMTVARKHVELLRDSVNDDAELNARPLQPVNGRNIQLYTREERTRRRTIEDPHYQFSADHVKIEEC